MKWLILLPLLAAVNSFGQVVNASGISCPTGNEPVKVKKLFGDSLVSSFMIWITEEVKPHRHKFHSEHVLVVEGRGEMVLNEDTLQVEPGSIVFIPKGSVHSVKVTGPPLKVISIQAPHFDGSDREWIR